ncbi:hypothetical protein EW146_g3867 [Bondarzewia mesenterica]|uniref:Uncharacterized protein n=1 Tax=Bondarzewia mesenterica TaxID=1095465 RepID=A0A4S4LW86_9AGAM|nr:hypothetical protein EW146_g3867 [Bondarzewia mesenterica]
MSSLTGAQQSSMRAYDRHSDIDPYKDPYNASSGLIQRSLSSVFHQSSIIIMPMRAHSRLDRKVSDDLHRIRGSKNVVLQYDIIDDCLESWFWPINMVGERVTPTDLEQHRHSHCMYGSCYLCPRYPNREAWKEAAIYITRCGQYAGEWIAACASGRCDYIVPMERIYPRLGVPVKRYAVRDEGDLVPSPVVLTDKALQRERLQPFSASTIPTFYPPARASPTAISQLLQLNSTFEPGLTMQEFRGLFARCGYCDLFMTRRAIDCHDCAIREVIDLTVDSD